MEGAMRLGLWRWPREEQDALRSLFCRVAMLWFNGGDPVPLQLVTRKSSMDMENLVSVRIVKALLMLRINPFELFAWLGRANSPRARGVLVGLTAHEHLIDEVVYYVLNDTSDEPLLNEGVRALDRLALDALQRIATDERLICLWDWANREDRLLARTIENTEPLRMQRALRLLATERQKYRLIVQAAVI